MISKTMQRLIELRRAGYTYAEIAKITDTTAEAVRRDLWDFEMTEPSRHDYWRRDKLYSLMEDWDKTRISLLRRCGGYVGNW